MSLKINNRGPANMPIKEQETRRSLAAPKSGKAARSARHKDALAKERFSSVKTSAIVGDVDAMFSLASYYEFGVGARRNRKKAFEWYRKAARRGNRDARYTLGVCYSEGVGVPTDDRIAYRWFARAAREGDPDGMCAQALALRHGRGVHKNHSRAYALLREAEAHPVWIPLPCCPGKPAVGNRRPRRPSGSDVLATAYSWSARHSGSL